MVMGQESHPYALFFTIITFSIANAEYYLWYQKRIGNLQEL